MKEKLTSIEKAISLVTAGDLITTGGVSFHRAPMELVREVVRQGKQELRLVDLEPAISFDLLIGAGAVKSIRFTMVTFGLLGFALNFRKAAEEGKIELIEDNCGAALNAFRAGSIGIPFIPIRGIFGTDLLNIGIQNGIYRVMKEPFTGEDIVAVKAIEPDVALIHAQRADIYGNVQIWGARFEDVWKAKAAKKVIVSVEEIVDHEMIRLEPYKTTLPYLFVDAVVHSPNGAYPTSCYGFYDADYKHIGEYVQMTRDGKFQEYLNNYVYRKAR